MDTPRIKTSHAYGEVYPNVFSDFDWVRAHRKELLETYGESVILVYNHEVIGNGKTLQEATENAERNLPAEISQVTPIIEYLRYRLPFLRVKLVSIEDEN